LQPTTDGDDSEEVDWLTLQPTKNKGQGDRGRPANSVMAFTPKMDKDIKGKEPS
jgi:hypothetical protein